MRIFWEVPIPELSRQWLIDEHRSLHAIAGSFKKNLPKNPNFTWAGNKLSDIKARHDLVVKEMIKRGYAHNYKSEIDEGCKIIPKKDIKKK